MSELDDFLAQRRESTPRQDSEVAPLDSFFAQRRQEALQRARAVYEKALATNPDQAAEAQRLAAQTGLPADTVERNLDEVRRKEQARLLDLQRLAAESPILARQLADPTFTKQAHDDIDTLDNIGRTLKGTAGDIGVTALKGAVGLPQSIVGVADLVTGGYAGKAVEATGVRFKETQQVLDSLYSPAQQAANRQVEAADGFIDTLGAMLQNPSTIATAVGESLPQMVGGAAVGRALVSAAPRVAPWIAAAFGEGTMAAGSAAEQFRAESDDGLIGVKQTFAALGTGAGTALFGMAGGRLAARMGLDDIDTALVAKGMNTEGAAALKQGFVTAVTKAGISEGVFEELPQSMQEQMWQNYVADRPLGQGVGKAAAQGLLAGFSMGGGFQAIGRIGEHFGATQEAQDRGQQLQTALQTAAQSKLRERNPDQFRTLMQQMAENTEGAPQEVYVDAAVLNQLPQDVLQALPENVLNQMAEALAANDVVSIPVADVLTVAPGTALEQAIVENARIGDPMAMTQAEAKVAGEQAQQYLAQEAERVIAQAQDAQAMQESSDRVKQGLVEQLNTAGRFSPAVNEAYATWTTAFYTTMAGRLGITPEEMATKYPLKIGAQAGQGAVLLGQSTPQTETPEFKNWFGESKVVDESGKPLVVYHGTTADFEVFEVTADIGFHAGSIDQATFFTKGRYGGVKDGANVKALYMKIENPLEFDEDPLVFPDEHAVLTGNASFRKLVERVVDAAGVNGQKIDAEYAASKKFKKVIDLADKLDLVAHKFVSDSEKYDWRDIKERKELKALFPALQRYLESLGYDGFIYENELEGQGLSYAVFSPTQIKSAIGNRGTFDPNDPNILNQGARGTFNPATLELVLTEKADLSTFLHETGHFFLEVMTDLASQPNAPAEVQDDMAALLKWFGIKGDETVGGPDAGGSSELAQGVSGKYAVDEYVPAPKDRISEARIRQVNARGLRDPSGFESYYTPVLQAAYSLGQQGVDLSTAPIVEGVRYGAAPEMGVSHNFANDVSEAGLSLAQVAGGKEIGSSIWFKDRKAYEYRGVLVGEGSDGEAVILPLHVENFDDVGFYQDGNLPTDNTQPVGRTPLETWNAMTLDQKRKYHERFAESFEQYLMEGKAPSLELQPLFRKFKRWMENVYLNLKSFIARHPDNGMALSPEIRQVFDRMLATREQIAQAEEVAGMVPNEDATEAAVERLTARSLRDLKWTVNARAKEIKKLQAQAKELRKSIEAEVRAEVEAMPVYQARDAITRIKGEPTPEQLETIAEATGFTSASEMAQAIAGAGSKAAAIEGMTDQRMLERHGDLIDDRAIAEAANEAVHNEARARALATELKAQADALGARRDTGETNAAGSRVTVSVIAEAAKRFAADVVGRTPIAQLKKRAWQHIAAERRAGKRWQEATAAGKTEDAVKAKQDQVLNNAAAKAAGEAQTEMEKGVEYLKKFDKDTIRKKLPPEYLDQIDALLEKMDLRVSVTGREIARRASLRKWVESQQALGLDPIVPDEVMDAAQLTSYKEMTVDEMRGMIDIVKNIEHLGRLKGKLLAAKDKREFDAAADAWAKEIRDNGGKVKDVKLEGDGRIVKFFKGAWADHRKLNSLIRQFAGGAENSEGFKLLIRSMNERGTQEDVMIEKASIALAKIHAPIEKLPGGFSGAKLYIPEIRNSLTRAGRLAVALNWGNSQNRQRVRDGDGWTDAQVGAILRTLTPTELQFVNDVWEYLDSFWPEIKAKQERVNGTVEEKVEAEPFAVIAADGSTVQMRGGYYPIKYDGDRSLKSQKQEAEQLAKDMLRGAILRPTTRRGHTEGRVDEVVGRPVKKDLSVITQHVTQVVHDIAWHEWAIDANRLLNDPRISSAIRDHYGPETHRAMTDALEAIIVGDVAKQTDIDRLLLLMRANVTRSIMGASLTTALLQPFGLTQSMARIGVVPVLKGAGRWAGDAVRMENSVKWIGEKSDFMRLRAKTFNRDIREISQRVQGKSKIAQVVDASLFMLMQKMQMVADVPTWIGAYEKALNANPNDEALAIQLADEAVLSSQGGGNTRDLSGVQRSLPFLTQFYSYFNTTLQLVAESTAKTDFKNPRAAAGWLGDMVLLTVIPAILPALITFLLKGGGEDDEPEEWAKRLAEWQASYMLGMFVGLRELPALWSPFDYQGPPAGKLVNDGKRLVQQAGQGEIDDQAVLATIGFLGTALGLPTTQIIRSYKGWHAWDEGDAPVTSVLFGPPPKG